MSVKLMKSRYFKNKDLDNDASLSPSLVRSNSADHENDSRNRSENSRGVAPLPAGVQKFEQIPKNVYLCEKHKMLDKALRCDCETSAEQRQNGEVACGAACINRLLMFECDYRCPCKEHCTNKRFENQDYAGVRVREAGDKGHGLFAEKPIEKGQFIIEYVGEVIDQDRFHRRLERYEQKEHVHHYFMALEQRQVIDATKRGSISRFINHSCDPNAETQKWIVNRELRIGFFAKRAIAAGDEVVFDYQYDRFGRIAQKCLCGAANCRGWMGGTEEAAEEAKEALKKKRAKRRRELELVEDKKMENDLAQLAAAGQLRNRNDAAVCNRLMARGGDYDTRGKLLQLLMLSDEPGKKAFLILHGCSLIYTWMLDEDCLETVEVRRLRVKLLQLLRALPIPHRNMIEDSKVLSIVERWANPPPPPPPPTAAAAVASADDDSQKETQEVLDGLVDRVCSAEAQQEQQSSSCDSGEPTPCIDLASSDDEEGQAQASNRLEERKRQQSAARQQRAEQHHVEVEQLDKEIVLLAQQLLLHWKALREHFKIPKSVSVTRTFEVGKRSDDRDRLQRRGYERTSVVDKGRKSYDVRTSYSQAMPRRAVAGSESNLRLLANESRLQKPDSSSGGEVVYGSASAGPSTPQPAAASATPTGTPASTRKRPSRFDRRTPPPNYQEEIDGIALPDEDRPEFEHMMSEIMAQQEQQEASSQHHHEAQRGGVSALLFMDPTTQQYWWKDRISDSLVYPATPEELQAYYHHDCSVIPRFVYDPEKGLVHQVNKKEKTLQQPGHFKDMVNRQIQYHTEQLAFWKSMIGLDVPPPPAEPDAQVLNGHDDIDEADMEVDMDEPVASTSTGGGGPSTPTTSQESPVKQELCSEHELPPDWRSARDTEGQVYYYNVNTRQTQWDPPPKPVTPVVQQAPPPQVPKPVVQPCTSSSSSIGGHHPRPAAAVRPVKVKASTSSTLSSSRRHVISAADTSSDTDEHRRKTFKFEINKTLTKELRQARKDGRFASEDDYKHLCRAIVKTIMEKELQRGNAKLEYSASVKKRTVMYIKGYAQKKLAKGRRYSRHGSQSTAAAGDTTAEGGGDTSALGTPKHEAITPRDDLSIGGAEADDSRPTSSAALPVKSELKSEIKSEFEQELEAATTTTTDAAGEAEANLPDVLDMFADAADPPSSSNQT